MTLNPHAAQGLVGALLLGAGAGVNWGWATALVCVGGLWYADYLLHRHLNRRTEP